MTLLDLVATWLVSVEMGGASQPLQSNARKHLWELLNGNNDLLEQLGLWHSMQVWPIGSVKFDKRLSLHVLYCGQKTHYCWASADRFNKRGATHVAHKCAK
eukprot:839878-Amphidinium_carterae.1